MNTEILGWIATVLLLSGYVANAHQKQYSWLIWFVGNGLMSVYAHLIGSMSVLTLSIVLMILNLYGYNKWRADK